VEGNEQVAQLVRVKFATFVHVEGVEDLPHSRVVLFAIGGIGLLELLDAYGQVEVDCNWRNTEQIAQAAAIRAAPYSAMPVNLWRIDVAMVRCHRQIVVCGDVGRSRTTLEASAIPCPCRLKCSKLARL
jgi:hypothetical protein